MANHRFAAAAISGLALIGPCTLVADWNPAQAASRLSEAGEYHLALFNGETEDGYMRLGWYRSGDELVLYDRTMMPSAEVYETLRASMGAGDLSPRSVNIRFHQGTTTLLIDAGFDSEGVSGHRVVERIGNEPDKQEISAPVPDGALLRAITFVLPLVLDPEPGQVISYDWYAPLSGQVQSVTLTSESGGTIETPAGSFNTTRWALRGGFPENDIYVWYEGQPRVVRIDVIGQPLRFLAVKAPEAAEDSPGG